MSEGKVRIIWEEKKGGHTRYYGGVDSTYSDVLGTWVSLGKHPNDFNVLINDARVKPHLSVPCILWCSGYEVGVLFQGLKDRNLCREVTMR